MVIYIYPSETACVCVHVKPLSADSSVLPWRPVVQQEYNNHPLFSPAAWKRLFLAHCVLIKVLFIHPDCHAQFQCILLFSHSPHFLFVLNVFIESLFNR